MQCLLHSSRFIYRFNKEFNNKGTLAKSLHDLIKTYSLKSDKSSTSPTQLKSDFGKKYKKFAGYSQQDSQEFVRLLLEEIAIDINRVKFVPKYKEIETKNKSKMQLNEEYHSTYIKKEDSVVGDSFYGQTCNIFVCECGFESYAFEKFVDLPLLFSN